MNAKGRRSSEFAGGGIVALFLAAHEKLGINWMDESAIVALTWITVAYIAGRSAVKVAAALRGNYGQEEDDA